MPEVKVGLPSVVEAALLPRLIGWGRTSWLLLTAENIDAATADRWGLVEQVVPAASSTTRSSAASPPSSRRRPRRCGPEAADAALGAAVDRRGIQAGIDAMASRSPMASISSA
jgi:enoyl-CoA hydratase/carnithine racemase